MNKKLNLFDVGAVAIPTSNTKEKLQKEGRKMEPIKESKEKEVNSVDLVKVAETKVDSTVEVADGIKNSEVKEPTRLSDLLPIKEVNGSQYVNARDLHANLGVGRDFPTWIRDRITKYGFIEGKDYQRLESLSSPVSGSSKARPQITFEYYTTLAMAKELAIVENNDKGREIRQYLIKVEQAWNTPELIIARALQVSNEMISNLHKRLAAAEYTIEIQQSKAEYYDTLVDRQNNLNIRTTAKEFGIKQSDFVQFLLENKYLYRDAKKRLQPYAEYISSGMFTMKEWLNDKSAGSQVLITVEGRDILLQQLKQEGLL